MTDGAGRKTHISGAICTEIVMEDADVTETALRHHWWSPSLSSRSTCARPPAEAWVSAASHNPLGLYLFSLLWGLLCHFMVTPLHVFPSNGPRTRWGQRHMVLLLMSSTHQAEPGSRVSSKIQASFSGPLQSPGRWGSESKRECRPRPKSLI